MNKIIKRKFHVNLELKIEFFLNKPLLYRVCSSLFKNESMFVTLMLFFCPSFIIEIANNNFESFSVVCLILRRLTAPLARRWSKNS